MAIIASGNLSLILNDKLLSQCIFLPQTADIVSSRGMYFERAVAASETHLCFSLDQMFGVREISEAVAILKAKNRGEKRFRRQWRLNCKVKRRI